MSRASSWPADDVDREAERALRPAAGTARAFVATRNVLVATARTADGCRPAQPLAEAREAGERGAPRVRRQMRPRSSSAGADAQRLAPGVEAEDLVALDAADLEPEAVRAHVDDGERRRASAGTGAGAWHARA